MRLTGRIHGAGRLTGVLKPGTVPVEVYQGAYEFTPTEDTQTIEIENKKATANITINPIPTNYGRITWNGVVITIT